MMYRFPRNKERYSLAEARSLVKRAFAAAAELRGDCDVLPPVSADGASECPSAENLHFQKDKSAGFVRKDLAELKEYAASATNLARICRNKLDELAEQRSRLHHDGPQKHFLDAENTLRAEMEQHEQMSRNLQEAIVEVEATLQEARSRRFPGREPRGPYGELANPERAKPQEWEDIRKNRAQEAVKRVSQMAKRADAENG